MSTVYIALTIGPIYKTLSEARKTRAVWASSYFFSFFIRSVLEKCREQKMNIYLPYSEKTYYGAFGSGLYADRLYFVQDGQTTKKAIEKITGEVISLCEQESGYALTGTFLKEYLNLHIIEVAIEKILPENTYPLEIINKELDKAELFQNYPFNIEANPVQDYIVKKAGNETFLAKDAFGKTNKTRMFRSIPEIATTSLARSGNMEKYNLSLREDFKNEDTELIDELIKNGFEIKPRHKYYAVLYADGDNIGDLLKEIDKKGLDIGNFSEQLFEFGLAAEKEIAAYGGNGIYLGGEDILAFLPVACITADLTITQTFLALVQKLDDAFENTIVKFAKDNNLTTPSLSYGIMISYIKYPLKESMGIAHDLLEKAKEIPGKNAIGLRMQKHSGQYTECFIKKANTASAKETNTIVEEHTKNINEETASLLGGMIHRFADDLFFELYYLSAKEHRLEAFFANFFNENIHKQTDKSAFLKKIKQYSEIVVREYPSKTDCRNILYTILKFIHFINSDKEI